MKAANWISTKRELVAQEKASSPFGQDLSMHDRKEGEERARRVGWNHIVNGLNTEWIKEGANTKGENQLEDYCKSPSQARRQELGVGAMVWGGHCGEKHHGDSLEGQIEKDMVTHTEKPR